MEKQPDSKLPIVRDRFSIRLDLDGWVFRPLIESKLKEGAQVELLQTRAPLVACIQAGEHREIWLRCGAEQFNRNRAEAERNFGFFRSLAANDVKRAQEELREGHLVFVDQTAQEQEVDEPMVWPRTNRPAG